MGRLQRKGAVITGAASGIGKAAASLSAFEGTASPWPVGDESSFVNGHALVVDGGPAGGSLCSMQPQIMCERSTL